MSRSVLVVEDEDALREVISEYCALHGFEVLEATNGLEALVQVKRARPSAVVLDLMLPRLGGLDALKRIRAFDPSITVVVVTGAEDAELHRRARSLGAAALFVKPVRLESLLSAIGGTDAVGAARAAGLEVRSDGGAGPSPSTPPGGRILIIDDEPEFRALLEEMLTAHGYEVRSAEDGASGLRAILHAAPDVVLLDIEMPGLRGNDALIAIGAIAPALKVIMVSGTTDANRAQRALGHGAFDYVAKPVDFAYLLQSIAAALMVKRLDT
jgi:CheY-like chemotaxis protein